MKLKTIEDLNEEFRKNNIPQRMSGDEFNDYWEEQLRAEAIKWRKHINPHTDVLEFIEKFFNITSEDLKNG